MEEGKRLFMDERRKFMKSTFFIYYFFLHSSVPAKNLAYSAAMRAVDDARKRIWTEKRKQFSGERKHKAQNTHGKNHEMNSSLLIFITLKYNFPHDSVNESRTRWNVSSHTAAENKYENKLILHNSCSTVTWEMEWIADKRQVRFEIHFKIAIRMSGSWVDCRRKNDNFPYTHEEEIFSGKSRNVKHQQELLSVEWKKTYFSPIWI